MTARVWEPPPSATKAADVQRELVEYLQLEGGWMSPAAIGRDLGRAETAVKRSLLRAADNGAPIEKRRQHRGIVEWRYTDG